LPRLKLRIGFGTQREPLREVGEEGHLFGKGLENR
jgi:hypothetical protein